MTAFLGFAIFCAILLLLGANWDPQTKRNGFSLNSGVSNIITMLSLGVSYPEEMTVVERLHEQDWTGRDRTGQDGTGRDRTGQDGTCPVQDTKNLARSNPRNASWDKLARSD